MKRFSLILASLVLVFGAKASAFVGGPFDNGDYSGFLDNTGIYQVAFRMSNGSGFAQFGNNANTDVFRVQTGTTTPSNTLTVVNRSIIYYKGVTYLGTCFGMVDHERKIVSGVTNGNSDVTTTTSTTGNSGGGVPTNVTTSIIASNLGFPANSEFKCKIHTSYPVLKFNGTGTLTIVNPSLAQTAFAALANFVSGISPVSGAGAPPLGTQIAGLITNLQLLIDTGSDLIPSAESVNNSSEHVKMFAFGSRVFFVNTR